MMSMRAFVRRYNVREQQGMDPGQEHDLREAILIIYEARFGSMGAELRAALDLVRGEGVLLGLVAIAATCSHEEAIAAVHQAGGVI
jgi:hypothetical protein